MSARTNTAPQSLSIRHRDSPRATTGVGCHFNMPDVTNEPNAPPVYYRVEMPACHDLEQAPHFLVIVYGRSDEPGINLVVFPVPKCANVQVGLSFQSSKWFLSVLADDAHVSPVVRDLVCTDMASGGRPESSPYPILTKRPHSDYDAEIARLILDGYGMNKAGDVSIALIPGSKYLSPIKILESSPKILEWYVNEAKLPCDRNIPAFVKPSQEEHAQKMREGIQAFAQEYGLAPITEEVLRNKLLRVLTRDVLAWLVKSFEDSRLKEVWYSDNTRRHAFINKILAILRKARCMERDLAKKSTPDSTVPAAPECVDATLSEKKPTLGSLIAELKAGNFSWLKFFGVPFTPRRKPLSVRKLKRIERSALSAKDAEIARLREQLAGLTQTVQTLAVKIETISGDK